MTHWNLIEEFKDGAVRYRNPFARTESWYTPGRRHRPLHTRTKRTAKPISLHTPQDYCAFCPAHYFSTTPEKSRFELHRHGWHFVDHPLPEHLFSQPAQFRHIGNLYEIISFDYWQENYGHKLDDSQREHQRAYLESAKGREHVISLLRQKQKNLDIRAVRRNPGELERLSAFLFGGSHDLVVTERHYRHDAVDTSHVCGTGDLTPEEHGHYFSISIHAAEEIYHRNPFVEFVCVYTNWLRDAGASFEHLHRQILGADFGSEEIVRGGNLAKTEPQVYEDYARYLAFENNFILCENEHAVAFADVGRPFPTIAVFSRCAGLTPAEHKKEEVRGISDIVHAVHAALGTNKSVNEEWYYSPPRSGLLVPWYILIKWRNHHLAGIEGITNIFPNEFSPLDIKERLAEKMLDLRRAGRIANLKIDSECNSGDFALLYWRQDAEKDL